MSRRNVLAAVILAIVISMGLLARARPATAAPTVTLTINSTGDNTTSNNYLTLREAILIARNELGRQGIDRCLTAAERAQVDGVTTWDPVTPSTCNYIVSTITSAWIVFGPGYTISIASPLPGLPCGTWISSKKTTTRDVIIDGAGASAANGLTTDCTADPSNINISYLAIEHFDSSGIYAPGIQAAQFKGLRISANGSTGLYLKFGTTKNPRNNQIGTPNAYDRNYIYGNGTGTTLVGGHGILIEGTHSYDNSGAMNNTIENNYIGINANNVAVGNSENGIYLKNAWNNTVGGDSVGKRNIICDNGNDGVKIDGHYASTNIIGNNHIGLDPLGFAWGNHASGIAVVGEAEGNILGGLGQGNTIVGSINGIYVGGGSTLTNIAANYIGTNASSATNLGNTYGVKVEGSATWTQIGTNADGWRNIISGNTGYGVFITGTSAQYASVEGNLIGTTVDGTAALPNGVGVFISGGAKFNKVGTLGASLSNVISGNSLDGIVIEGSTTTTNTVYSNYIGTNLSGSAALGNAHNGVLIRGGANQNTIGDYGSGNVISGNGYSGVYLGGSGTAYNGVYSNTIGLNAARTAKVPNSWSGVSVYAGPNHNTIGAMDTGHDKGNVIAGNGDSGIDIQGSGCTANGIYANRIGTNTLSSSGLGNGNFGVRIRDGAQSNHVGSVLVGNGNTISGNGGPGVGISGVGTSSNDVVSNQIGTNTGGTAALPNNVGVKISGGASSNVVGGPFGGNRISGNASQGVWLLDAGTSSNTVTRNNIGTNYNGTAALGNANNGILVDAAQGNIIGDEVVATQFISGNGSYGIRVVNADRTQILKSNAIGVGANGTTAIQNGSAGIFLDGATNTLVLAGLVANNQGPGVSVTGSGAAGNRIAPAVVKSNTGLAIDLGNNGFTPNDPGDSDTGPNTLLNYPIITSSNAGVIGGKVCPNCTVLIYQAIGDPTAAGGGGSYRDMVLANSSGNWNWNLPTGLSVNDITAIAWEPPATWLAGNTSEMSPRGSAPLPPTYRLMLPLISNGSSSPPPPPPVPAAPGPITVTVLSTSAVNVAWSDNSTNETSFTLEQKTGGGSFAPIWTPAGSVGTGVVITTVNNLSANTSYTFRVKATNGAGSSAYATSSQVTTPSNSTTPAVPTGFTVTPLDPWQLELSWANNANNATDIGMDRKIGTAGTWYSSAHGGNLYAVVPVEYTTVWDVPAGSGNPDDEVFPNTQYCYRLRAQNGTSYSAWTTAAVCGTTPPIPTINAPNGLTATGSGMNVTLTWNDNSSNETGFRLETKFNGGAYNAYIQPITMTAGARSVSVAMPQAGTYAFRLRAFAELYFEVDSAWTTNEPSVTLSPSSGSGAVFTNRTSYPVISLRINGEQKIDLYAGGAIPAGGSRQFALNPGTYNYSAITGTFDGTYSNEMWYYPGSGTYPLTVNSGSIAQAPAFLNPTITQLLSDPEGTGATYRYWVADTAMPYVHYCFAFNNAGNYQFRGASGVWTSPAPYSLVSYPGDLYVYFAAGSFRGKLSETSIVNASGMANPFFYVDNGTGGTTLMYYYSQLNNCP